MNSRPVIPFGPGGCVDLKWRRDVGGEERNGITSRCSALGFCWYLKSSSVVTDFQYLSGPDRRETMGSSDMRMCGNLLKHGAPVDRLSGV
jgi:hypothetical protein